MVTLPVNEYIYKNIELDVYSNVSSTTSILHTNNRPFLNYILHLYATGIYATGCIKKFFVRTQNFPCIWDIIYTLWQHLKK